MNMTETLDHVPTRSSRLKERAAEELKVVVFESRKPKVKKGINEEQASRAEVDEMEVIDMKRARHEIVKFGMTGLDAEKKAQVKLNLAVSLGAKPPKNKYQNYKKLQEERKKKVEKKQEDADFQQLGKNKFGKSNAKGKGFDRKRRKEKGALLDKYGKPT